MEQRKSYYLFDMLPKKVSSAIQSKLLINIYEVSIFNFHVLLYNASCPYSESFLFTLINFKISAQ